MKKKITATVLSQKEIAPRIFDMWIATDLAEQAKAGQFIGVYPKDRSTLLPRPISICQVSDKKDALRIVYRIAGQGTAEFSSYTEGDSVEILGTLGNGFPTEAAEGKKVFLDLVKTAYGRRYRYPSHAGAGKRASGFRRKADHRGLP